MDGGTAWKLSFSSCFGSVSAPTTRVVEMRPAKLTLAPPSGRLCSLLVWFTFCCLLLVVSGCQRSAYAQTDEYELVDSISIQDESYLSGDTDVPAELMDLAVTRTDSNEVLTVEGDAVTLRSAADVLDGVDSGSAVGILWDSFSDSYSSNQATDKIMLDLIWRYYNADASKREPVPVVPYAGNWPTLAEFDNMGQWYIYMQSRGQFVLYTAKYRLVGFDDGASWSYGSPNAEIEYQKWYEWYEGSSQGGSSGGGIHTGNVYFYGDFGHDVAITDSVSLPFVFPSGSSIPASASNTYAYSNYNLATGTKYLWAADGAPVRDNLDLYFANKVVYFGDDLSIVFNIEQVNGRPQLRTYLASNISTYNYYTGDGVLHTGTIPVNTHDNAVFDSWDYVYRLDSGSVPQYLYMITNAVGGTGGGAPDDEPVWPVFPEPETPVQPVTPTTPTPSNPVYSDNDTTSTTVDLQPILDAIRRLNTNVMAGFSALETDLAAYSSAMTQILTSWFKNLSDWLELIWQELRETNQWLEGIFYSLGNGGSASEPDITVDSGGWWDWLAGILSGLLGDLPAAVSELTGTMDGLRNLFPFSIPWDIAALLALFVSEPVTPVFDFPLPYGWSGGSALVASIHVDLSQWDGVMSAVRSVELAIFALGLALRTRQLLSNVEVSQ